MGRGEGEKRSLIVPALCSHSLRPIPSCPYDGWKPFWSGHLVFGIMVDWELGAVRFEKAAVPSALQTGPLGASALPTKDGGAINQPI